VLVLAVCCATVNLTVAVAGRMVVTASQKLSAHAAAIVPWLFSVYFMLQYVMAAVFMGLLAKLLTADGSDRTVSNEQQLMWSVAWLSAFGSTHAFLNIPAVQCLVFAVASAIADIAFVTEEGVRLGVSSDIALIAFLSLLAFRAALVWCSYVQEASVRDVFASRLAVVAAEADATGLLRNLFPESIVTCLVRGEAVPSRFCPNVAVLYADLVGFTVLASKMTSMELMEVLNVLFRCANVVSC
jgi:hypothetical protein